MDSPARTLSARAVRAADLLRLLLLLLTFLRADLPDWKYEKEGYYYTSPRAAAARM